MKTFLIYTLIVLLGIMILCMASIIAYWAYLIHWTEVEDVIEYDTFYEQFIIPSNYQLDCKVISWSYI